MSLFLPHKKTFVLFSFVIIIVFIFSFIYYFNYSYNEKFSLFKISDNSLISKKPKKTIKKPIKKPTKPTKPIKKPQKPKKVLPKINFLQLLNDQFKIKQNIKIPDDSLGHPPQMFFSENPKNWDKCLKNVNEKYILKNKFYEPEKVHNFIYKMEQKIKYEGCFSYLIGSNPVFYHQIFAGIQNLKTFFYDKYPLKYPIVLFHFNLNQIQKENLKKLANVLNIDIKFVCIKHHLDHFLKKGVNASSLSPEPIEETLFAGNYHWTIEYRFQNYHFPYVMFQNEEIQKCRYVHRIDADINLLEPMEFDIFQFMKRNNLLFTFHHWGVEPHTPLKNERNSEKSTIWIAGGLIEVSKYYTSKFPDWWTLDSFYMNSEKKNKNQLINEKNLKYYKVNNNKLNFIKQLNYPPHGFDGGGCFATHYVPFFASPMVTSLYKYIDCLGGVWTHRWADQSIFPLMVLSFMKNPEHKTFYYDIPLLHANVLYRPHLNDKSEIYKAFVQKTPQLMIDYREYYRKKGQNNELFIDMNKIDKKGFYVYFIENFGKDEKQNNLFLKKIDNLKRSLINLENHVFQIKKSNRYPIFVFVNDKIYNSITKKMKTEIEKQIKSVKIKFLKTKSENEHYFFGKEMFEREELTDFDYFIKLDPETNIIADLIYDLIGFMFNNKIVLGAHRSFCNFNIGKNDMTQLALFPDILKSFQNFNKVSVQFLREILKIHLKPRLFNNGFTYLKYFYVGEMKFFRSSQYGEFVNYLIGHKVPLRIEFLYTQSVMLFEKYPWDKAIKLGNLFLNWNTNSNNAISSLHGFPPGTKPILNTVPIWPFVYKNYNPI